MTRPVDQVRRTGSEYARPPALRARDRAPHSGSKIIHLIREVSSDRLASMGDNGFARTIWDAVAHDLEAGRSLAIGSTAIRGTASGSPTHHFVSLTSVCVAGVGQRCFGPSPSHRNRQRTPPGLTRCRATYPSAGRQRPARRASEVNEDALGDSFRIRKPASSRRPLPRFEQAEIERAVARERSDHATPSRSVIALTRTAHGAPLPLARGPRLP